MLKGRVDAKGKKNGKRKPLLGRKKDEVVDDQQVEDDDDEDGSPFIEGGLSSMGKGGASITREDVQTPTPILKPVVRCRFHGGFVKYKVCPIPLSKFTTLCLLFQPLSPRRSTATDIAIV